MSSVRPFNRNDIAEVADLFADTFLHDQQIDSKDLRSHVGDVYFDHPFRDDECPSFVYCDANNRIAGFLGVMPRPMRFGGEIIKTAIAGNLMIKGGRSASPASADLPTYGHQLAPAALVKAFFRCPHDLALTDTAVDSSRRIWERCGGQTIRLYSLRWLWVMRPFKFGLGTFERQGRFSSLARLSKPLGRLLDRTIKPIVPSALPSLPEGCSIDQVEIGELLEELDRCRHYDLTPAYSPQSLDWVLQMARSKRNHGEFRTLIIRQSDGGCLGWVIYHRDPKHISHVLQLYAHPKEINRVFDCLLFDAAKSGTMALSGKVDPLFMDQFARKHCLLRVNGWSLAHARRAELLQPFYTGRALFSELESEGWTRFIGANPRAEFTVG